MENELRSQLIAAAEELSKVAGISEQAIGQGALKDNTFFARIRGEGRDKPAGFTVRTYDRVMAFIADEMAKASEAAE